MGLRSGNLWNYDQILCFGSHGLEKIVCPSNNGLFCPFFGTSHLQLRLPSPHFQNQKINFGRSKRSVLHTFKLLQKHHLYTQTLKPLKVSIQKSSNWKYWAFSYHRPQAYNWSIVHNAWTAHLAQAVYHWCHNSHWPQGLAVSYFWGSEFSQRFPKPPLSCSGVISEGPILEVERILLSS